MIFRAIFKIGFDDNFVLHYFRPLYQFQPTCRT